jgi:hypothetical protein
LASLPLQRIATLLPSHGNSENGSTNGTRRYNLAHEATKSREVEPAALAPPSSTLNMPARCRRRAAHWDAPCRSPKFPTNPRAFAYDFYKSRADGQRAVEAVREADRAEVHA